VINCCVIVIFYSTAIALLFKSLLLYYLLLTFHSRIAVKVNCVLCRKVLLRWVQEKKGEWVNRWSCLLNSVYAILPPDFMSMQENWCRRSMWVQQGISFRYWTWLKKHKMCIFMTCGLECSQLCSIGLHVMIMLNVNYYDRIFMSCLLLDNKVS